jgi:RNA polymerase sigma factor (sigma-70 family)
VKGADLTADERKALVCQWLPYCWVLACKAYWGPLAKQLEVADLFQAGVIGLMRATEKYEPGRGAFSTYAHWWIRSGIGRALGRRLTRPTVSLPDDFDITRADDDDEPDILGAEKIEPALAHLPARQQEMIRRLFGFKGKKETLGQVGEAFGVSKARIGQLRDRSLDALRQWLREGSEPARTPQCMGSVPLCGAAAPRPCYAPARRDGFCPRHHPRVELARLQRHMSSLFDEAEATDDLRLWQQYGSYERVERQLLAAVDRLQRPAA